MKFPIFVLPNLENRADVHMLDADGSSLTATEFSRNVGGIKSLRLMVNENSIRLQKPQITKQDTATGDILFCFAYPSGSDSNNRITTGSIVFRESDVDDIISDPRLRALADRVGIGETFRRFAKPALADFKSQEEFREKKSKDCSVPVHRRTASFTISVEPCGEFALRSVGILMGFKVELNNNHDGD